MSSSPVRLSLGRPRSSLGRLVVGTAAAALLVTACGGGDDSASAPTSVVSETPLPTTTNTGDSTGSDLAAMVPEAVKSDGKIVVGTDATYAPNEFLDTDGQTVIGFDVDLFNAVAEKLGLEAEYQPAPFDAIITGVDSGKYEIGVSSFTINDDRKKQVNMVSYFSAGTQWGTKAGNPAGIDIDNACGKKIAVQKGTVQVDDLTARSKTCTDGGKPAITIDQYQAQSDATTAVVTGKDDAFLADSPVIAYAVKQTNGQLELLGDIYDAAPYGYVVPKDQADFAEAITAALDELIADGGYTAALEKWGVEAGAITDPAVNP